MKAASVRSVFWAGTEAAVSAVLSFLGAFVIARLIGPSEFGIGAAAVAVHVLLWVTVNALFSDALVQCAALDDGMASSAFWGSSLVGLLAAAAQAGCGWALAVALHDSRLVPMCLLLAPPLPLVGAGGVVQGLLTRRRAYRALAGRAVIGQGLGTLAGVVAALSGAGAWAPVLQQAVGSGAGALTLLLRARWRPRAACRRTDIVTLLRVGLPLTASTLVLAARYRLFALLLGGTAGPSVLGETHMAFRLVDTVRELSSTALWRLTLPVLSEHQADIPALRAACDRMLRWISLAMLPLCGLMALAVGPFTARVLGRAWMSAGAAAEPLIALMAVLCVMFPAGVAVVARGQIGRAVGGNLACAVTTLAGVAILRPGNATQAALVWVAAQLVVLPYSLWINGRALGTGMLRPLRAALPMLCATGVALAGAITVPALAAAHGGWMTLVMERLGVFLVIGGLALVPLTRSGAAGWTGTRQ
ncbi:MAG TPA: oligosaccharide flippase family protein [Acetobacteraceae bacterium]|jgi:PST family polysaccharide transporter